jgi:hypothetical protein
MLNPDVHYSQLHTVPSLVLNFSLSSFPISNCFILPPASTSGITKHIHLGTPLTAPALIKTTVGQFVLDAYQTDAFVESTRVPQLDYVDAASNTIGWFPRDLSHIGLAYGRACSASTSARQLLALSPIQGESFFYSPLSSLTYMIRIGSAVATEAFTTLSYEPGVTFTTSALSENGVYGLFGSANANDGAGQVLALTFDPNTGYATFASTNLSGGDGMGTLVAASADGQVCVIASATSIYIYTLSGSGASRTFEFFQLFESISVVSLAMSGDGLSIVIGEVSGIRLLYRSTRSSAFILPESIVGTSVAQVSIDYYGRHIAVLDSNYYEGMGRLLVFIRADTGGALGLQANVEFYSPLGCQGTNVQISAEGELIVVTCQDGNGGFISWLRNHDPDASLMPWKTLGRTELTTNFITGFGRCLALSSDGKYMLGSSFDGWMLFFA